MLQIYGARLKPQGKNTEYITLESKIKSLFIKDENKGDSFQVLLIDDKKNKFVKTYSPYDINKDLLNKTLPIVNIYKNTPNHNVKYYAKFNDDGTIDVLDNKEKVLHECMINQSSLDQLKKVADISKKTDIGIKTKKEYDKKANIFFYNNPLTDKDIHVETYDEYVKKNYKK